MLAGYESHLSTTSVLPPRLQIRADSIAPVTESITVVMPPIAVYETLTESRQIKKSTSRVAETRATPFLLLLPFLILSREGLASSSDQLVI